ncbi:glycosyltransferase family protein [uncultured Draconibacterium sp.]|uniref:glycosyltransferase family protein n=1 Tax=uncultured Draconibacterium sp. TaxID=1573823 RepID=UPI002AA72657|nr:glycosyltransferase family protein [uncultured Draconibacterium sp.]
MKILYAIQGTGNGHLTRATEIIPLLNKLGETDILVSGIQGDILLPFEVKYKFYGISFILGKKGGVDIWTTLRKARPGRLLNDIRKLPVREYDLVINDFEPVTAWACKLRKKPCIGLSHQNAVLHRHAPRPAKKDVLGEFILKHYAPASGSYGFHFKQLDAQNFTPVIRSSIRKTKASNKGHYTVYLPAFSDSEIEKILGQHKSVRWEVFSKHCPKSYTKGSIRFNPVSLDGFNQSFVSCSGIVCTAGFETPAEALFMGKKLCVIPMKNQYNRLAMPPCWLNWV